MHPIKEERPDWSERFAVTFSELSLMIQKYERDMAHRKCVVPVDAGDLQWLPDPASKMWRIFCFGKPLAENPIATRARYGRPHLERLADAADAAMRTALGHAKDNS